MSATSQVAPPSTGSVTGHHPKGNPIVGSGPQGRMFEVIAGSEIIWRSYIRAACTAARCLTRWTKSPALIEKSTTSRTVKAVQQAHEDQETKRQKTHEEDQIRANLSFFIRGRGIEVLTSPTCDRTRGRRSGRAVSLPRPRLPFSRRIGLVGHQDKLCGHRAPSFQNKIPQLESRGTPAQILRSPWVARIFPWSVSRVKRIRIVPSAVKISSVPPGLWLVQDTKTRIVQAI